MNSPAQVAVQFADVKEILDQCLAFGGGNFTAKSPGAAVHFRQRCYKFRKQYRDAMAPAPSPYDRLTLRGLSPGVRKVEILVMKSEGEFVPNDGPPVFTPEPEIEIADDDPLMQEAAALRRRLDL